MSSPKRLLHLLVPVLAAGIAVTASATPATGQVRCSDGYIVLRALRRERVVG